MILGTAAVIDSLLLQRAIENHGDKIAVGVDIKDGFVVALKAGWRLRKQNVFHFVRVSKNWVKPLYVLIYPKTECSAELI